jgi:ParB-like chromosome segregation protein Spo0J
MNEQMLFNFTGETIEVIDYDGEINIQEALNTIKAVLVNEINNLPLHEKVNAMNHIKETMHAISPFKTEPVDLIKWVPVEDVVSNDYNPNAVAPPEMELLRHSINHDGYTQPVVTWMSDEKDSREVIDGFHRSRVCREFQDVHNRVHGFLPVVTMRDDNLGKNDRVASTIRHNRARGKHKVDSMSDIVVDLKKRNWTDKRICKELGMDPDEVLRLCQVSGLVELFQDQEFTKSWDVDVYEDDLVLDALTEEDL